MRTKGSGLMALALAVASATAAAAETTLTLASAWNARQNFTADFLRYVDAVNEAGKGIVQIRFLGEPEAIPEQQLLYALRRGVVDMAFGGMTYYRGVLPEGDALFASTLDPTTARERGALDLLQPYWAERINARLVGWVQSGINSQIYLREEPRFRADGMPDLRGLVIRTSPSNRELLDELGARPVQIPVSEVYTALERGMVDGIAFTTIGILDLDVERFIRWRLEPPVLQLAACLQVNLDTWRRLPPAAQRLLEDEAARYERAFRQLAFESVWQRLARRAPASAVRLRSVFWPEGLSPP